MSIDPTAERSGGSAELGRRAEPGTPSSDPPELDALDVSDAVLMGHGPFLRRVLSHLGVPSCHLDDVTQETLIGAWTAIRARRFRPPPGDQVEGSLRRWLVGIAFRQWTHLRDVAYRRREIATADPWAAVGERGVEPDELLAADALLKALACLPPVLGDVLALLAVGATADEIAHALGLRRNTAYSRIRRGRAALARSLSRWRRLGS